MTILDISYHQGKIDFEKVKRADHVAWPGGKTTGPIEGVIIKFTGEEIGKLFIDPKAIENWKGFREVGMRIGGYHFMNGRFGTRGGKDEALYFLDAVSNAGGFRDGDFLPVMDVEWPPEGGHLFECQQMDDYIVTMQEQGLLMPIMYTGRWYIDRIKDRDLTEFTKQCPLWQSGFTAKPPAPPRPWDKIALWQFTDKGYVDGIPVPVDLNQRFAQIGEIIQ